MCHVQIPQNGFSCAPETKNKHMTWKDDGVFFRGRTDNKHPRPKESSITAMMIHHHHHHHHHQYHHRHRHSHRHSHHCYIFAIVAVIIASVNIVKQLQLVPTAPTFCKHPLKKRQTVLLTDPHMH